MVQRRLHRSAQHAFTLLEMAVVLALIGLITAAGLITFSASLQSSQYNATITRMNAIDQALLNFSVAFGRLPCPSNLTCKPGTLNYGAEGNCSSNVASCSSGTTGINYISSTGPVEGGIPTRALQLPDTYQYDGWGSRINYAVDPTFAVQSAPDGLAIPTRIPMGAANSGCRFLGNDGIDILDASGNYRSSTAVYALFSHGQNQHGAHSPAGAISSSSITNTQELANCHCASSGTAATYHGVYTQMLPTTTSTSDFTQGFDDIVSYKELWQLQTPAIPLQPKTCMYVAEQGSYRISQFLGTQWTGSLNLITGVGLYIPKDLTFDASGNLWVVDYGNNRIIKLDPYGNLLLSIPPMSGCQTASNPYCTASSTDGQFSAPWGVTLDSSGYVWIGDYGNNRLQKFDPNSGAWIQSVPPSTASGCGNASPPACTNNTSAGRFFQPVKVIFDKTGNMWVVEFSGQRIQELDPTGTLSLALIGASPASAALGYFYYPDGMAFDVSGNIWVSEYGNNRVQQLSPTGTPLQVIPTVGTDGCQTSTTPACPASSAAGEFSQPYGLALSPTNGLVWIPDRLNNRIQGFQVGNGTAVLTQSIPPASTCTNGTVPACTASNAYGQTHGPNGITFFR